jgi:AcrR family transcriptional regulator
MGNKKRERRDRKEEILIEATKRFSTYGFRGTSLAPIAEAVGLTEPGLLHYFPSKVALLQGVLEYREKQDKKKYAGMFDSTNLSLPVMIELMEDLVSENEKKPGLIRLFTVLVTESIREDHPSHDYFVNRYVNARQRFSEVFAELAESGQIKPGVDTNLFASIAMAVMDGLQIQWLLDPENVSMTDSFNLFAKMIGEYLDN